MNKNGTLDDLDPNNVNNEETSDCKSYQKPEHVNIKSIIASIPMEQTNVDFDG